MRNERDNNTSETRRNFVRRTTTIIGATAVGGVAFGLVKTCTPATDVFPVPATVLDLNRLAAGHCGV